MKRKINMKYWQTELFENFSSQLSGQNLSWLQERRRQHYVDFLANGFPDKRQENWKYTDLSFLNEQSFRLINPGIKEDIVLADWQLNTESHLLVFVNGQFQSRLSSLYPLPEGVVLTNMAAALQEHAPIIEQHWKSKSSVQALVKLNAAFMHDGLFLYVPNDIAINVPIHLLFISTQECMVHARNLLILESGSKATVFEHFVTKREDAYFNNVVTEVQLKNNARLQHYKLQQESTHAVHVANFEIVQEADSQIEMCNFSVGSKLAREDICIDVNGKGGTCFLNGLYLPKNGQHIDHHIQINHNVENGQSQQNYKGIVDDGGHAVFNGKIVVQKNAQQTKAHQSNKNLLLAKTAEVNTKPELEIYADDVQCTHGATVGQIDSQALFYLRARGIDLETAMSILTAAFAGEILDKVKVLAIKEIVSAAVG